MSAEPRWPWSVLGLEQMPPTAADVRRAYARALKKIDQSKDIEGFAALRAAYEAALAQREKADGRNAERRANRAAEHAKTSPEPAAEPPQAVQPDAATLAAQAEQAAFTALLHEGLSTDAGEPDEVRMLAILDSRFMEDPARRDQIGRAFATALRAGLRWSSAEDGDLNPAFSPRLVNRLDAAFGWLSDQAAFLQVFGRHDLLQHLLLLRANGDRPYDKVEAPRKSWLMRLGKVVFAWPTLFFLFLAAKTANSLNSTQHEDLNQAALAILMVIVIIAVCVGALRIVMFLHGLFSRRFHSHSAAVATFLLVMAILACLPLYGGAQNAMYGVGLGLVPCLLLALSTRSDKTALRLENWLRRVARRLHLRS